MMSRSSQDTLECGCFVEIGSSGICREVGDDVIVTDPDFQNPVAVSMFITEGGGIFGVDTSYLESDAGTFTDPFDGKNVVIQDGDGNLFCFCRQHGWEKIVV